jgi:putative ABC transport system substrate-binding protein
MRRRDFITLVGGATAWPLAARAQTDRVRLVGVLMPLASNDPEVEARVAAFLQTMAELGWNDGRNIQVAYRWGTDSERHRKNAAELVALAPDVILVTGSPALEPLLQATHSVPVVFAQVSDPVGAGLVESLSRPGGNATGFTATDYTAAGKWLELLKEVAPNVKRAALLRDANNASGVGQWGASAAFAGSFGLDLQPINAAAAAIEIERAIEHFAPDADCGMVVTNTAATIVHRDLIIALAARHRLPAVYPQRLFAVAGGLISYGNDSIDPYRRAAGYVDRILKGTKPSDLPVQNPTKYELVINQKAAKAIGLVVPASLLARADEVIE